MTGDDKQIIAVFLIYLVIGGFVFMTLDLRKARMDVSHRIERIEEVDFSELEEEAPIEVILSLGVLEATLKGVWFLHISEKREAIRLSRLFKQFVQDGKLTLLEYREWMRKFERESVWLGKEEMSSP